MANGLSMFGVDKGSYSCLCSRANILLFLTREARLRFSIDERFLADGDPSRSFVGLLFSVLNRLGEPGSRLCQ